MYPSHRIETVATVENFGVHVAPIVAGALVFFWSMLSVR